MLCRNQKQTLYSSWARLVNAKMRATQARQWRAWFTHRGMTEGFVVVKQVRQVAFEEFSRFLYKHWDDIKDWVHERGDSNDSNVLGASTSNAMREQGLITFHMKVHAYNYSEFSLPATVAANTMSVTQKAADNQRRLDLHKDLLGAEDEMEKHFLAVMRRLEVENYAEEMFKEAQKRKITALGVGFTPQEEKAARTKARSEAAEAENDGLIEHTGPLNDRERVILRILHTGYALKLDEHCTCIGTPSLQAFITAVRRHNFVCEQGFKSTRDQLLTARNKSVKNVENVVLIKDMYQYVATRGVHITVERDDDSSDEEDSSAAQDSEFYAATSFNGVREGLEFKLGCQGLGYYRTHTRPSRFKAAILPRTEPRAAFGHIEPPEDLPEHISGVMIKRCRIIRELDWPSIVKIASVKTAFDEKTRDDATARRQKRDDQEEKRRRELLETPGGFVIDPTTGARVRLSPAYLLAPGLTMCNPSCAENKWVRDATCNQFKLFNHYKMLERCPALKQFLEEAKLLEGPDPKDKTGRTIKTGFTTLPECNGNVSDIKVGAPECVVRLQKLQQAMAKAGIGSDLNLQLVGGSGLALSRMTAPPPVCPTAAPPLPPPLPTLATGATPMATDDEDAVRTTPTTLRELEMAPTCSELDDMDVDEDADTFSDSECCGANEFDPLCRGEE